MKLPAQFKLSFIKSFLALLLFLSIGFLAVDPVNAQEYTSTQIDYNTYSSVNIHEGVDSDVQLNRQNAIQIVMIELFGAISCQLSGINPVNADGRCLGVNSETGKIGYLPQNGGAIAVVGSLINATFTPPASGVRYMAHLKNNFGFAKQTYAQTNPCLGNVRGVGFCGLEPLLPIWETMRNIVYLLFVLVFIIIGMGIMLRIHIDPRTIMTIQNQIPKIIVGIVAITFSFAIAGFLVDVMWVTMYLFASVITIATQGTQAPLAASVVDGITHANSPFDAANLVYPGEVGIIDLSGAVAAAFASIINSALTTVIAPELGLIRDVIVGIVNVLAFVIILIAILVALIRLLVVLILAYINVILDVIFAPWWILAGLIPGSSISLGAWIRDILANLAVFPVSIAFFLLGSFLVQVFVVQGATNQTGNFMRPPLMGGANPTAVGALIGFGFILMLPNVLNTVKQVFKTPKMNFGNLGGPIGSATGFAVGVPRSVVSTKLAAKEVRMETDPNNPGQVKYGNVGTPMAFARRIFK